MQAWWALKCRYRERDAVREAFPVRGLGPTRTGGELQGRGRGSPDCIPYPINSSPFSPEKRIKGAQMRTTPLGFLSPIPSPAP